jgi:hypothetical protein
MGAAMIQFGPGRRYVPRWTLHALVLALLAKWPWPSFKVNNGGYEPYRCPGCARVRWTRADTIFCYGAEGDRHSRREMKLIRRADAPDFDSPGIVTT